MSAPETCDSQTPPSSGEDKGGKESVAGSGMKDEHTKEACKPSPQQEPTATATDNSVRESVIVKELLDSITACPSAYQSAAVANPTQQTPRSTKVATTTTSTSMNGGSLENKAGVTPAAEATTITPEDSKRTGAETVTRNNSNNSYVNTTSRNDGDKSNRSVNSMQVEAPLDSAHSTSDSSRGVDKNTKSSSIRSLSLPAINDQQQQQQQQQQTTSSSSSATTISETGQQQQHQPSDIPPEQQNGGTQENDALHANHNRPPPLDLADSTAIAAQQAVYASSEERRGAMEWDTEMLDEETEDKTPEKGTEESESEEEDSSVLVFLVSPPAATWNANAAAIPDAIQLPPSAVTPQQSADANVQTQQDLATAVHSLSGSPENTLAPSSNHNNNNNNNHNGDKHNYESGLISRSPSIHPNPLPVASVPSSPQSLSLSRHASLLCSPASPMRSPFNPPLIGYVPSSSPQPSFSPASDIRSPGHTHKRSRSLGLCPTKSAIPSVYAQAYAVPDRPSATSVSSVILSSQSAAPSARNSPAFNSTQPRSPSFAASASHLSPGLSCVSSAAAVYSASVTIAVASPFSPLRHVTSPSRYSLRAISMPTPSQLNIAPDLKSEMSIASSHSQSYYFSSQYHEGDRTKQHRPSSAPEARCTPLTPPMRKAFTKRVASVPSHIQMECPPKPQRYEGKGEPADDSDLPFRTMLTHSLHVIASRIILRRWYFLFYILLVPLNLFLLAWTAFKEVEGQSEDLTATWFIVTDLTSVFLLLLEIVMEIVATPKHQFFKSCWNAMDLLMSVFVVIATIMVLALQHNIASRFARPLSIALRLVRALRQVGLLFMLTRHILRRRGVMQARDKVDFGTDGVQSTSVSQLGRAEAMVA